MSHGICAALCGRSPAASIPASIPGSIVCSRRCLSSVCRCLVCTGGVRLEPGIPISKSLNIQRGRQITVYNINHAAGLLCPLLCIGQIIRPALVVQWRDQTVQSILRCRERQAGGFNQEILAGA